MYHAVIPKTSAVLGSSVDRNRSAEKSARDVNDSGKYAGIFRILSVLFVIIECSQKC